MLGLKLSGTIKEKLQAVSTELGVETGWEQPSAVSAEPVVMASAAP